MPRLHPHPTPPITVRDLSRRIKSLLHDVEGIAPIDIDELTAFSCHMGLRELPAALHRTITRRDFKRGEKLAHIRRQGTPTPLIVGEMAFYKSTFIVKKGVLLPRPETELLVEHIAQWIKKTPANVPVTILELGVGSGAIGLSLAAEFPTLQVLAWDISRRAVNLAQANQRRLNITNCIMSDGDFFKGGINWIKNNLKTPFIIVSNPPYIPSADVQQLDPSVLQNDPKRALDGGPTGLRFHTQLIQMAATYNCPLFLEIGYDQKVQIEHLAQTRNLLVRVINDYAGHPRIAHINNLARLNTHSDGK